MSSRAGCPRLKSGMNFVRCATSSRTRIRRRRTRAIAICSACRAAPSLSSCIEKRALLPDMAMRLGKLLGTPPESRLRMQTAVDLWDLVQRGGYDAIDAVKAA